MASVGTDQNLVPKYYIEPVTDTVQEKFKMVLRESILKNKALISFPHGVDAFRSTDESYTLLTQQILGDKYGQDFYTKWTFFKIENSEYLQWISKQTYHIYDNSKFKFIHFCILGEDSMVDIITTYEPTVTLLDESIAKE
jgi:hypothetical protein